MVLANAAEEYTEWQVFALWVRALLDACEGLPAEVAAEVATRSPDLFSRIASAVRQRRTIPRKRCVGNRHRLGGIERVCQGQAGTMAECNPLLFFQIAFVDEGMVTLEEMHREWGEKRPETLPTYEVWVSAASAVCRLSNPESDAQNVLDSIRLVPEDKWKRMLDAFAELTTLCVWIEILLGAGQIGAELVSEELALRYPRFDTCSSPEPTSSDILLREWVLAHEPPFANAQQFLFALSYQTKRHPAYYARRSYAAHCRSLWSGGNFDRLPSFADWRSTADAYFRGSIPQPDIPADDSTVPSCASLTSVVSDFWAGRRGFRCLPMPSRSSRTFFLSMSASGRG